MFICMRTTLILDDQLLRQAKARAAEAGSTLTRLVQDALREKLHRPTPVHGEPLRLKTFRGKGVQPGINLDSHAELLDRMEQP
jgi:hypothetical protein